MDAAVPLDLQISKFQPLAMPKPMPELTVAAAVPPNRERVYFEGCDRFPFFPRATECHLPNAWWLAEASFAAYERFGSTTPLIDLSPVLAAGYELRRATVANTQFISLEGKDVVIVAFRGTRLEDRILPFLKARGVAPNWADVVTDAKFLPKSLAPDIFVHEGFHAAYAAIEPEFGAVVAAATRAAKPLWLCGHSLGGALATLAAHAHPGKIQGLYTFGSPRVGNAGFVRNLTDSLPNIWRFVHHRDAVTYLPLEGPPGPRRYVHAGNLKFITGRDTWTIKDGGSATEGVAALIADAVVYAGQVERTRARASSLTDPASWPITIEALADHSPMYYTNKIFNAHEECLGH
jgi:pimeloyl-ACP methyl ester carboxylesterase